METATVNAITNTATSKNSGKAQLKEMDKNSFLSLLVAQLKNQDPTSNQDPAAMVQQMTSFSSLEQMQNMNSSLTGIQNQNTALFQAQSASLIGKQVQVTSAVFDWSKDKTTIGVSLSGSAANVTLKVLDGTGKVVRTLDQGAQSAGDHVVEWDGKDASGNAMAPGSYAVQLTAVDGNGNPVGASTSASLRVDSVYFSNNQVMVLAGGRTYSLSDIKQISA